MAFEQLGDRLQSIIKKVKGQTRLTEKNVEEMLKEIRLSLLEADVNFKVVKEFIANVKEQMLGEEVLKSLTPGQMVVKIVKDELVKLFGDGDNELNLSNKSGLSVLLMVGLQGSGKTTASAKLASFIRKKKNKKSLLVACDVYRPAAIDQLKTLGQSIDVEVYSEGTQVSPVTITKNALGYAKANGFDNVIIDTAGRLHIDETLMQELKDIVSVASPNEILLVVDAMSGQDIVNVASSFYEALRVTGAILTKMDGDARGGAALSVKHLTGVPIKFIGVGEKIDDLEAFYPDRMADRILGMGDVISLIEKAQENIDEKKTKKGFHRMMDGKFNLEDMLEQMEQIGKMGPLKGILKLIPGMPKISEEDQARADAQLKNTRVIIQSMTVEERRNPEILRASRKIRIAKGCGKTPADVNKVINQYEKMKEMAKQLKAFSKNGKNPFQ
ncbi:MAG: signal recognition particle protein [Erysipelotrichaceae bacterium]|nr:signal recognition particle protein [Erysipelotrichaceae bacterium]